MLTRLSSILELLDEVLWWRKCLTQQRRLNVKRAIELGVGFLVDEQYKQKRRKKFTEPRSFQYAVPPQRL